MRRGTALHSVFEHASDSLGPVDSIERDGYRFDFNCGDIDVLVAPHREVELVRNYAGIKVTGHADGIWPDRQLVTDYKTTERFDFDRYMTSFQWKFYLDMAYSNEFLYQVFILKPFGEPHCYSVNEFHTLKQYRYPELHNDCLQVVRDYREVVIKYLEKLAN